MKILWFILAAAPAFCLNAQTNLLSALPAATNLVALTNATPGSSTNTPAGEAGPTRITSDHFELDRKNHVLIYSGHVVVTNIQLKLMCEKLTASSPTNSTQVDHLVAEGNVHIDGADNKGRPVHAVSDRAIYLSTIANSVTNRTMTLTGNVYVDSALAKGTADPIIWDLVNDKIHAENQDMQIIPETKGGTNAPSFKPLGKSFP